MFEDSFPLPKKGVTAVQTAKSFDRAAKALDIEVDKVRVARCWRADGRCFVVYDKQNRRLDAAGLAYELNN